MHMNFLDLFGNILKPVGDFFTRRAELKAAEHTQDLQFQQALADRRVDLIKQGLAADASWETQFATQAANSWKDEFELLVLSCPLIMCFVPAFQPYVVAGFQALDGTPEYFKFLVMTIYLANYGIRFWRKTQSDT
jgi:hypothetical protein